MMEDPEKEISGVIHQLTQSSPLEQRHTIETYFTPNASFIHPFCRTWDWDNSIYLIRAIYRWYKIMSPRIDLAIHSIAFDQANLLLYVNLSQVFRIWVLPFYSAPVNLVTVIQLQHNENDAKYYIASQNDLYQIDEWVKFIPFLPGASLLVRAWQITATAFCVIATFVFWPFSLMEKFLAPQIHPGHGEGMEEKENKVVGVIGIREPGKKSPKSDGAIHRRVIDIREVSRA